MRQTQLETLKVKLNKHLVGLGNVYPAGLWKFRTLARLLAGPKVWDAATPAVRSALTSDIQRGVMEIIDTAAQNETPELAMIICPVIAVAFTKPFVARLNGTPLILGRVEDQEHAENYARSYTWPIGHANAGAYAGLYLSKSRNGELYVEWATLNRKKGRGITKHGEDRTENFEGQKLLRKGNKDLYLQQ